MRRIHQSSGGNPLYALAIADELRARQARGAGTRDVPIPPTLADAITTRLGHVDRRARDALLVAAAVSHPTLGILQAVVPEFALSDLDSAERSGVIALDGQQVRFAHPLLAAAYEASAPPAKRRELHRVLAAVVQSEEERAHHLARGAEAPDHATAAVLEQASGAATDRGAPEAAADLLEDAARLTPIDAAEARQSRLLAAAEQHYAASQYERARVLLEQLLRDLRGGPIRARALAQLGWMSPRTNRWQPCFARRWLKLAMTIVCALRSERSSRR